MSHWNYDREREDGDEYEKERQQAFDASKWLRGVAERSQDPGVRAMIGDLARLELAANPFFLGVEYDDDFSDMDEMGPF